MDCPGCAVELVTLTREDETVRKCEQCGRLQIDVADLNRLLLHRNLPGLESLGGKVDVDALAGQCSECLVDLVSVLSKEKHHPVHYETCESCGSVFAECEAADVADLEAAHHQLVEYFERFSGKKKRA